MIAVAKIGGHQALVKVGEQIEVDKIEAEVGKTVSFDTLLISEEDGTGFEIGTPLIAGKKVEAKILEQGRGEKIIVFKMKPRKRYRRTLGHRQHFTLIEITKIGGGAAKKAPAKPVAEKKEAPAKKPAAKKPVAKKPAPKKTK
jgi:large subunit ribosomal protein L21